MWANADVADFLDWLRELNERRPPASRVAFYGLDLYSLWDSLDRIIAWLRSNAPDALDDALKAWQCFVPFGGDPQRYSWNTRLVPESCEDEVVELLTRVRLEAGGDGDDDFDAEQNAEVVAGAERYYRAMVRADRLSWNVRDIHMADTIDRLAARFGSDSRGLVWEHNTHVGDARATDMQQAGMVNVGEVLRERHASDAVLLLIFPDDRRRPWLSARLGHRAIGVVYDPGQEHGNFVPTVMGARYDALLWFDETEALIPLSREARAPGPECETEPTGL
jgi:erythromycin esterase-like protein